jgi:signal transduction histidine kinase
VINEAAGFMRQVITQMETGGTDRGGQEPMEKDKAASYGPAALLMGLEKIESSVKRARRITHQLLGHVKKQDMQFCEVRLKILLNETLDLLKNDLQEKNIQIDWDMDPDGGVLWSDPYQLRQVLMNILSNAVHAVSKNGVITLSSRPTDDDIVLEIRDNGTGIPKENLGKIFDPFFTTKPFEQGTGLGLFVVHKILSNLNGDIQVDSKVGRGSSFKIRLPRRFDPGTLKGQKQI